MEVELESTIIQNISMVRERIQRAALRADRRPKDIELIAVTKEKSAVIVKTLLENGLEKIGESYLKEAQFKIDLLKDYSVDWHMIGNIQSGKEKHVARIFQQVHSVGSERTAEKLAKSAGKLGKILPVYLELNVSGESTKQGWLADKEQEWEKLVPVFERILAFQHLQVKGLMTMAPYSDQPENARPYFKRLRKIRGFLNQQIKGAEISGLSMGMSGDFEVAIEEGATALRIGSALVGSRN